MARGFHRGNQRLQWGRIHADAEGKQAFTMPEGFLAASMGPHPCGCGGAFGLAVKNLLREASMGPHPCGCGGSEKASDTQKACQSLQWGRIHADAEGGVAQAACRAGTGSLQWGRIHADAEGVARATGWDHIHVASMGPHPCGCGGPTSDDKS